MFPRRANTVAIRLESHHRNLKSDWVSISGVPYAMHVNGLQNGVTEQSTSRHVQPWVYHHVNMKSVADITDYQFYSSN